VLLSPCALERLLRSVKQKGTCTPPRRRHLSADAEPALSGNDPGLPGLRRRGGKPVGHRALRAAHVGDQCRRRGAGGALSGAQVRRCLPRLQGAGAAVDLMRRSESNDSKRALMRPSSMGLTFGTAGSGRSPIISLNVAIRGPSAEPEGMMEAVTDDLQSCRHM
jgi:hypothetical protein